MHRRFAFLSRPTFSAKKALSLSLFLRAAQEDAVSLSKSVEKEEVKEAERRGASTFRFERKAANGLARSFFGFFSRPRPPTTTPSTTPLSSLPSPRQNHSQAVRLRPRDPSDPGRARAEAEQDQPARGPPEFPGKRKKEGAPPPPTTSFFLFVRGMPVFFSCFALLALSPQLFFSLAPQFRRGASSFASWCRANTKKSRARPRESARASESEAAAACLHD